MADRMNGQTSIDIDEIGGLAEAVGKSLRKNAARPALSFQGEQISYEKLGQDAGVVAGFLRNRGQKHKSVLLFLEQGPAIVASILGCLQSGAVFCPVHLQTPEQRLLLILEELGADLVITDPKRLPMWEALAQTMRLPLTIVSAAATREGLALTESIPMTGASRAKDYDPRVAYVYFSSGSTGAPKGILGRADSLAHFLSWEIGHFHVTPDCVVSQLTPPSFDPFLRDILVPLCVGGRVAIPQPEQLSNPRALAQWFREQGVTLTHMVPSLFRVLLSVLNREQRLPAFTHILLAGEMLYGHDVARFYERMNPEITLANLYGPTETTLAKFCHIVSREDQGLERVPVGFPIEGTEARISGSQAGARGLEEGELLIKAPYEPLGYLNPELTKQRFFSDPDGTGGVWYRTGDLARSLPNGEIELTGRLDSQVKIRGMLVQPEEVETVLGTHPLVQRCAVFVLGGKTEQPVLAAAVELRQKAEECTPSVFKDFLAEKLPGYMVPAVYECWDALPVNTSGKIDRIALAKESGGREEALCREGEESPRGIRERLLSAAQPYLNGAQPETIDFEEELVEYGVDSLSFVSLLLDVETEFQIEFEESVFTMDSLYSLERILQYVLEEKGGE